jgi:hypothetical protein
VNSCPGSTKLRPPANMPPEGVGPGFDPNARFNAHITGADMLQLLSAV